MSEWEDIRNAPMDDALIVLRYPDFCGGRDEFAVGRWSVAQWGWVDEFGALVVRDREASHFLLLPEPPK